MNDKDKCCFRHDDDDILKRKEKIFYIISLFIFIITFVFVPEKYKLMGFLFTILLSCDIIVDGIKNIFKFNFEESTLMTIAVIAAFILGEYPEGCLVILLYKLGEFIEDKIVQKSQNNVEDIAKIKEEIANLIKDDGSIETVKSEKITVGQKIMIKPGEKIPLDCKILEGTSNIDESIITGESKTISVKEGDNILSGSINLTNMLIAEVKKDYKHSMTSQIADLVQEATSNKGKTEKFITKFSKIYTPTILLIAIVIPVILIIFNVMPIKEVVEKSLIFLVASCPCSLVISIPVAMFAGVGAMAKKGLLLKGTKYMEVLSNAKVIAFDKTGTLTTGKMILDKIEIIGNLEKKEVLQYIANIEKASNHPIAKLFLEYVDNFENLEINKLEEIPGYGIHAIIEGKEAVIGNEKILKKYNIDVPKMKDVIYFAMEKKVIAYIILKEEIKKENETIVPKLKKVGINRIIMLTGDNEKEAKNIGEKLGISEVYSKLLPNEKQEKILSFKLNNEKVIFVGDGINDSPVLAIADFGISMGKGAEIANTISDSILLTNEINKIPDCIKIAKKTMNIVKFNIFFSIFIKLVVIILGFMQIAPIWMAVLADTGVTMITVANSLRIRQ